MKTIISQVTLTFFCFIVASICFADTAPPKSQTENYTEYGAPMPSDGEVVPLLSAINNGNNTGQPQKIAGTVNKVCQNKGCWMILVDGDSVARVTFEGYKFFVPTDTYNQHCVVYGTLSEETLSPHMANHYAQDEGKAAEKVTAPTKEYTIVAKSVLLQAK